LSNGERVFLKYNPSPPKNYFAAEADGLRLIEKSKYGPSVPRFLGIAPEPNPKFLILEYIESSAPKNGFARRFGQSLAAMHTETQEQYGLNYDNFIGKTTQKNNLESDGLVFFREHRIRFQQEFARKTRGLPISIDKRLDLFCEKLETLLDLKDEKPALLHGDLWSGNYFASHDQVPYIFDPAVYFGLREADLAMTEMFGRLPEEFYSAYHEVFPTQPGYTKRKDIYNLYHLLNHYNLFGGSYLEQADQTVRCFLD
jgi:protein-ribulosamine 3-kinase